MPATHQGVLLENGPEPIANLKPRASKIKQAEDLKLSFLQSLNQRHLQGRESNSELEARIRSYELAANMQMHAPNPSTWKRNLLQPKNLYGLVQKETKTFGQQCLLARRLVERGGRFVQLYHGQVANGTVIPIWRVIRLQALPAGGFAHRGANNRDLKARGLLKKPWSSGGEFGRTPMSEKGDGRGP